eukprot:scaffold59957_cov32-Cyclotella_meneghiniana.AAC.2
MCVFVESIVDYAADFGWCSSTEPRYEHSLNSGLSVFRIAFVKLREHLTINPGRNNLLVNEGMRLDDELESESSEEEGSIDASQSGS